MDPFKINMVIIGAAKAGTTSLARWLGDHPECCLSEPKETLFFGRNDLYSRGITLYQESYYPHYAGERIVGEATPAYSHRSRYPEVPSRIHAHNPDTRIIYMVRDPIDRSVSAWKMWASMDPIGDAYGDHLINSAKNGFNKWLSDPEIYRNVVETSRYGWQLEAWNAFPENRRMIIFLEDMRKNRAQVVGDVAAFLGIDQEKLVNAGKVVHNRGEDRVQKTSLRSLVEKTWLWRKVKPLVPGGLKASISGSGLGSRPVAHAEEDWDHGLRKRFLGDLCEDNRAFLKACGKAPDLWKTQ